MTTDRLTIPDVDYHGKVRSTSPETSWLAAGLLDRNGELVVKDTIVAILLAYGPCTHEAIHAYYKQQGGKRTLNRIQTATHDLVLRGIVRRADGMGKTSNGNDSQLWEAKQ
jgi:hypothetical protein